MATLPSSGGACKDLFCRTILHGLRKIHPTDHYLVRAVRKLWRPTAKRSRKRKKISRRPQLDVSKSQIELAVALSAMIVNMDATGMPRSIMFSQMVKGKRP